MGLQLFFRHSVICLTFFKHCFKEPLSVAVHLKISMLHELHLAMHSADGACACAPNWPMHAMVAVHCRTTLAKHAIEVVHHGT